MRVAEMLDELAMSPSGWPAHMVRATLAYRYKLGGTAVLNDWRALCGAPGVMLDERGAGKDARGRPTRGTLFIKVQNRQKAAQEASSA